MREPFPSGAVILSIDTEHIWGYSDQLSEAGFRRRFPAAIDMQDVLLGRLITAGLSATWFVVGGMAFRECEGSADPRLAVLPSSWTRRIPRARESSAGLWYRPSFVRRLIDSRPLQEIGLHGGVSHLVWTHPEVTRQIAKRELVEGIRALEELGVRPRTFSYPRTREAYHQLLSMHGIRGYRGRVPSLAWQVGGSWSGAVLRAFEEFRSAAPPVVHPRETLPGLWDVPASMFFYPIRPSRSALVPARTRLKRFKKGVEAAIEARGVFQFSFHPENLAESPDALPIFDDMLDCLLRACRQEGLDVLTLNDVINRMERIHLCSTKTVTPAST